MMLKGPLREETVRMVIMSITEMLQNPTVTISISRGVRFQNNYETGMREASATDGKTIEIAIHGGAQVEEETAQEQLARLMKAQS